MAKDTGKVSWQAKVKAELTQDLAKHEEMVEEITVLLKSAARLSQLRIEDRELRNQMGEKIAKFQNDTLRLGDVLLRAKRIPDNVSTLRGNDEQLLTVFKEKLEALYPELENLGAVVQEALASISNMRTKDVHGFGQKTTSPTQPFDTAFEKESIGEDGWKPTYRDMDMLPGAKCPKCGSTRVAKAGFSGDLECDNCGYVGAPKEFKEDVADEKPMGLTEAMFGDIKQAATSMYKAVYSFIENLTQMGRGFTQKVDELDSIMTELGA
jgi:hypothetical protein